MRQLNRFVHTRLLLAGLILVLCASLAVGLASARYRSEVERTASVVPGPIAAPKLTTTASWTETADKHGYTATYAVTNPGTEEMAFEMYLLVSQGIESSDNAEVSFAVTKNGETTTYNATAFMIRENSPRYRTFGAGWLYEAVTNENYARTWKVEAPAEPGLTGETVTVTVTITFQDGAVPQEPILLYTGAVGVT